MSVPKLSVPGMPFDDFRAFLDGLRMQGELIDIDRPVAPK
jgi:3-polyprenyl-4-hydroxybenzoate decarboxylase